MIAPAPATATLLAPAATAAKEPTPSTPRTSPATLPMLLELVTQIVACDRAAQGAEDPVVLLVAKVRASGAAQQRRAEPALALRRVRITGRGVGVARRVKLGARRTAGGTGMRRLAGCVAGGMLAFLARSEIEGKDALVPRVPLRIAGVVRAELLTLLPVLEPASGGRTVAILPLGRAKAGLGAVAGPPGRRVALMLRWRILLWRRCAAVALVVALVVVWVVTVLRRRRRPAVAGLRRVLVVRIGHGDGPVANGDLKTVRSPEMNC